MNAPLLLDGDLSLTKCHRVVLKANTTVIKGKERKLRRRDWFNLTNVHKIHIYYLRKIKECTLNCETNKSSKLRLLLMNVHYLTTAPHFKINSCFLKVWYLIQPVMESDRAEDLLSGNDGYHLILFDKDHHLNRGVTFVYDH